MSGVWFGQIWLSALRYALCIIIVHINGCVCCVYVYKRMYANCVDEKEKKSLSHNHLSNCLLCCKQTVLDTTISFSCPQINKLVMFHNIPKYPQNLSFAKKMNWILSTNHFHCIHVVHLRFIEYSENVLNLVNHSIRLSSELQYFLNATPQPIAWAFNENISANNLLFSILAKYSNRFRWCYGLHYIAILWKIRYS